MIISKLLAFAIFATSAAGDPPLPAATDADAKQILVEMRVIQIDAPVMTLTFQGALILHPQPTVPDKLSTGARPAGEQDEPGKQPAAGGSSDVGGSTPRPASDVVLIDGNVSAFGVVIVSEGATIRAGDMTFHIEGGQLRPVATKDGAADSLDSQTIAAPRILTRLGQVAMISIGATVPYLVLRDDGCLLVEESEDVSEGMELSVKIDHADAERISFASVDMKISSVVDRQALAGVPFDLGRPVIRTMSTSSRFSMAPDKIAIIAFPAQSNDHTAILVLLRASVVSDAKQ